MRTVIFLDLDETLVSTRPARDPFSAIGQNFTSLLRPYAQKFLLELSTAYPLCLLTAGDRDFQTEVLKHHKIDHYFLKIFGRQDISYAINIAKPLVPEALPLLVDDLNPGSYGFYQKFKAVGNLPIELQEMEHYHSLSEIDMDLRDELLEDFVESHYLQIPVFSGKASDMELVKILPAILRKAVILENAQ